MIGRRAHFTSYAHSVPISPYIKSIREDIGRKLLLLPTVAVLPCDDHGRLLLVRQIDTGRWGTIGGSIEPDETPEEAAQREASEEAGISVRLVRILTVTGGRNFRITYPNGDEVACVSVVFEAQIEDGIPQPDYDETSEVGWFAPSQLDELDITEFNRNLLAAAVPLLPRVR